MAATLTIRDEGLSNQNAQGEGEDHSFELTFPSETITVRELIRERVYQEVADENLRRRTGTAGRFRGLVQPTPEEASLNAPGKGPREIDWKAQFELATKAFEARRVLVLVGETQATELDETITIGKGCEVTFLRLVPLVGG